MFKRLFEKCLDSYYSTKLIEYILTDINLRFMLDTEVKKCKGGIVELYAKPHHYNVYTMLFGFRKGNALNHLVDLRTIEQDFIFKNIEDLSKSDSWRKNEKESI